MLLTNNEHHLFYRYLRYEDLADAASLFLFHCSYPLLLHLFACRHDQSGSFFNQERRLFFVAITFIFLAFSVHSAIMRF